MRSLHRILAPGWTANSHSSFAASFRSELPSWSLVRVVLSSLSGPPTHLVRDVPTSPSRLDPLWTREPSLPKTWADHRCWARGGATFMLAQLTSSQVWMYDLPALILHQKCCPPLVFLFLIYPSPNLTASCIFCEVFFRCFPSLSRKIRSDLITGTRPIVFLAKNPSRNSGIKTIRLQWATASPLWFVTDHGSVIYQTGKTRLICGKW